MSKPFPPLPPLPDLSGLASALEPTVMARVTLLLNHVLDTERVATDRLKPHAGRVVMCHLDGWPALLPPPPLMAFTITPAGLLEWCGETGADATALKPDLAIHVDAANPALMALRAITGTKPAMSVSGDAALAGDINWLLDNLRWDIQDDLARVVGQLPAIQLSELGKQVAQALKEGVSKLRAMAPGGQGNGQSGGMGGA